MEESVDNGSNHVSTFKNDKMEYYTSKTTYIVVYFILYKKKKKKLCPWDKYLTINQHFPMMI